MVNERALNERLAALEVARSWSPRLVAKLESHIRSAEDEALFRINPFNFAAEKHSTDAEVVDLLYATSFGLFRMDWLLLCPKCSCVVESFSKLEGVHNRYHCFMCHSDYETLLDDYVAVSFTIDPQIREIVFHHPDRLSAWDFLFMVSGTSDGRLPDGSPLTDLRAATMKTVTYLPPGETTRIDLDAAEGIIFGVSLEGRAQSSTLSKVRLQQSLRSATSYTERRSGSILCGRLRRAP
jgi:hypothetical protein